MSRLRGRHRQMTAGEAQAAARLAPIILALYPDGLIPARDGGALFGILADELGIAQWMVCEVCALRGWWPWTPAEIDEAHRECGRVLTAQWTADGTGRLLV